MQIDLLPKFPQALDVKRLSPLWTSFQDNCFDYSVTEASASNTAKVTTDIMTKHTILLTTSITDKGIAFTSKVLVETAQILGLRIECPTTKLQQIIGKQERAHAGLKINLKMSLGECWLQWQKYMPKAVFNYYTTYVSTLGREPSRIFHRRKP